MGLSIKWRIYLVAAIITAIATYSTAANAGFSIEGIVSWIGATIFGGLFGGLIGNKIYEHRQKR